MKVGFVPEADLALSQDSAHKKNLRIIMGEYMVNEILR